MNVGLISIHHKTIVNVKVKATQQLQATSSTRKTVLVELDTSKSKECMMYEPGDHLGINKLILPLSMS